MSATTTRPGPIPLPTAINSAPPAGSPPQTIGQMILQSARRFPDHPAIYHKTRGSYHPITYREVVARATLLARGLHEEGIRAGDRLAIMSENRPEWVCVDLACQLIGVVDVPIYPTLPPGQVAYILNDSGCRAIVISDGAQRKKIDEVWPSLPHLTLLIGMDPSATGPAAEPTSEESEREHGATSLHSSNGQAPHTASNSASTPGSGPRILPLDEVMKAGQTSHLTEPGVREAAARVSADDTASIVYTSGTTGDPKGAILTQRNFMTDALAVTKVIEVDPRDLFLSFLPLNHVFERLAGYYFPLLCGAAIAYAESPLRVKQNLPEVQPTVLIGVPRLYEGMSEGILQAVGKAPAKRQKLFKIAIALGRDRMNALHAGHQPGPVNDLLWSIMDKLVLEKVRATLGCSRMRYLVSGSAPLPRQTLQFLQSLGIGVLEGYGLTETSPVMSVNTPEKTRPGSVGPAIDGVEIRIAQDGEILCRGPIIMQGYLNKPQETAEAIDPEGWFHTGDVGRLDEDGFLYITDRKKDLLVLATGKKVAPQPIEAKLKASPLIKEIVVLGDRMSSVVALVVPMLDQLADKGRSLGWTFTTNEELCALPQARKFIKAEIDKHSAGLAEFERIRQVALIDHEFTVESGELTPTLKVKRKVICERFANVIAALGT